ncbi:hypothetical protein [Sulfurospirillum tamanense]|nr:hypothetical protein [Sulfurospirillum tamanensis]
MWKKVKIYQELDDKFGFHNMGKDLREIKIDVGKNYNNYGQEKTP